MTYDMPTIRSGCRGLFPLVLSVILCTCGRAQETTKAGFGDDFQTDAIVPAQELLANYDQRALTDTVTTTLSGTVNEVCQKKGCWMTVAVDDGTEMMVKFKDYGFFVPMDIGGREIVMHGQAYYQVTPVDELRHYAEDAGKSAEEVAKITEPRRELRFLAEGVKLM